MLAREGIDFSISAQTNLNRIMKNKDSFRIISAPLSNDADDLINSHKMKFLVFYRSLCNICGEVLQLEELLSFFKDDLAESLELAIILRDMRDYNDLHKLIDSLPTKAGYFFNAEDVHPELDRFFLGGNPLFVLFDENNNLVRYKNGYQMNKNRIRSFLKLN